MQAAWLMPSIASGRRIGAAEQQPAIRSQAVEMEAERGMLDDLAELRLAGAQRDGAFGDQLFPHAGVAPPERTDTSPRAG
jgi:hypothetical protein